MMMRMMTMVTVIYECFLSSLQESNVGLHDLDQTVIEKGSPGKPTVNIAVCSCPRELLLVAQSTQQPMYF